MDKDGSIEEVNTVIFHEGSAIKTVQINRNPAELLNTHLSLTHSQRDECSSFPLSIGLHSRTQAPHTHKNKSFILNLLTERT